MKLRALSQRHQSAFTMAETLIAVGVGLVTLAILSGSAIALQRSCYAVESYVTAEGDQMRFSDYVALDVRRALTASVLNGVTINGLSTDNVLTLTIPDYYSSYDANGNPYPCPAASPLPSPASTAKNPSFVNGLLTYGGTPRTIRYYQQGSSFYREQNGTASIIANNVSGFSVNQQDLTTNVKCTIKFTPQFNLEPFITAKDATAVYTTTFLRNAGARQ